MGSAFEMLVTLDLSVRCILASRARDVPSLLQNAACT